MSTTSRAAVLFDLDGTFLDTADDLAASMNAALVHLDLPEVPSAKVRHMVGHGARRMLALGVELATGRSPADYELDRGLEVFLAHYAANIAVHTRPFEGAIALVEALRAEGRATAICTNKREALAVHLLETLGMTALFDAVVGGDTAEAAKPNPAPLRLCLERCGAARGVLIGDSDTDIRAAENAMIPCLLAEFGYGPTSLKSKASGVFPSYDKLGEMISVTLAD